MRVLIIGSFAGLVAACSSEAPPAKPAEAAPASLQAGEYEVTATVTSFRSTDDGTPVVQAKQGEVITSRACIGADGTPPAELFAAKGNSCAGQNVYARNGRLNMQLDCTRPGAPGKVMSEVNGSFTADSLKGSMTTNSFFQGKGDYELRADLAGRRVGECTAAPAAVAKS